MEKDKEYHEYPAISANLFGGLENTLESELQEYKCPERNLWQAVILQAIIDARSKKKSRRAQMDRFEATQWLCGKYGQMYFNRACTLAGFDPIWTRQTLIRAEQRGFMTISGVENDGKH